MDCFGVLKKKSPSPSFVSYGNIFLSLLKNTHPDLYFLWNFKK